MMGLSESQVRLAVEGLISDTLTGHRASLPGTPYVFTIEPSASAGMCVVVRDPETNVEHLRCVVTISARKIPSPHQPTFTPVSITVTPVNQPEPEPEPEISWRTGAWMPMKIRGGLDYRYAPVAGDVVLAPDGSGDRFLVVKAITKANPTNVTVRSVADPAREFTFPVDPSVPSPVKFVRAGEA